MNPLDSFPSVKLTKSEEAALAQGTPAQLEKLVLHTMREAVTYARHICRGTVPDGELISICYDVLSRGAKRWKTGWARFFAFCKPGVRGYVRRSWREKDVVRGATQISCEEASPTKGSHGPGEGEIWDEAEEVAPEHEIEEPDFSSILTRERWDLVSGVIEIVCNEREKAILKLTYQGQFNFQETADKLDLTRSAIQRTHRIALRKIRVHLLEQGRLLAD